VPDNIAFVWPASGAVQVTLLQGGGCNIRITFADRGIVRAIGNGRVIKAINVPTKRIARRYEILIRHENDFESSYSIVDQTPNAPVVGLRHFTADGYLVHDGTELYPVQNGGFVDFQLSHGGKLVDPREFLPAKPDSTIDVPRQSSEI
jgi:hypothetical protein